MRKNRENLDQCGASLLEYAVLVSMICLVAIVSVKTLGRSIDSSLADVTDQLAASGGFTPS